MTATTPTTTTLEPSPSTGFAKLAPLAAVACGALLPLALAPFDLWPLGLLSCAGLYWLWEHFPARCTSLGWWFGVGKYGVGASWIYVSIHDYGNASIPLAIGLVALFVAGMALFSLTQGWFFGRLRQRRFSLANLLLFVLVWVFWEWLLTWVMTGLPWLYLGYGHLFTPLGHFAPVGGVLLVSLAAVLSACALVFALQSYFERNQAANSSPGVGRGLWIGVGLCLLPWLLGAALTSVSFVKLGPTRSVALIQNNVDQNLKWLPAQRQPILQSQESLSEPYWGADVILWPESAITYLEHQVTPEIARWQRRGEESGTTLVFGVPAVQPLPGGEYIFYNAVRAVGAGQGRYLKHHLVPFGEYVPLEGLLRGLIDFFDLPMSSSGSGPAQQPLLRLGGGLGADLGAMAICYEIAFPALVAGQVRGAGEPANVLLTVSNDAWFGTSLGPDQHLQIAQMRAKENARYLLRATQTGWTAIIDEQGRVLHKLPRFQFGVLAGSYRSIQGLTPYSRWGNTGVLAMIVLLALVVVSLRASGLRGKQPS